MNPLRLDIWRPVRRYRWGLVAVAFAHALSLLLLALAMADDRVLIGALSAQLAAAVLTWSMVIDDLRANAAPEVVALVPGWQARQHVALRAWLAFGLMLPPLVTLVLLGPAAALTLAAVTWPAGALVGWFNWTPHHVKQWMLLGGLAAGALGMLVALGNLHQLGVNKSVQAPFAGAGLLLWWRLARRLPPAPGSHHSTHWRQARTLELHGEAIIRGEFHPEQMSYWQTRVDLDWARRHRPAPGRPNNHRQTIAQLRWLLGPTLHPKSPLSHGINLGAVLLVLLALMAIDRDFRMEAFVVGGGMGGLAVGLAMLSFSTFGALQQRRPEQGLLRLLPGMPAAISAQGLLRGLMLRAITGQLAPLLLLWLLAAWWIAVPWPKMLALLLAGTGLLALNLAAIERLLLRGVQRSGWHGVAFAGVNLSVAAALLRLDSLLPTALIALLMLAVALFDLHTRPRTRPLRMPVA